jgi:tetratricopeptide (TPR) repeat protein
LEDTAVAAIFAEGMQLARRCLKANAESQLVAAHSVYLVIHGAARDALQPLEEAVQRAGESGDPGAHFDALAALAFTYFNLGRLLPALAASNQAVELFEAASHAIEPARAGRVLNFRVLIQTLAGQLPSAAESLRRAAQLMPADSEVGIGLLALNAAFVALGRGEIQVGLSRAERGYGAAERMGSPFLAAFARWMRGDAQNLLEDFEGALGSFEQALATGALPNVEGYFLAGLARAHLGLRDHDRARLTAQHAIEVARQRGHASSECYAQLTLAHVLCSIDGAAAAAAIETALQEGERLIAATGAGSYAPRLHEERARLAGVLGDAAGRERELRAAHRLYIEMDAPGHAARLAQELGR